MRNFEIPLKREGSLPGGSVARIVARPWPRVGGSVFRFSWRSDSSDEPSGEEVSTTGLDAHIAAALAYLAGPFSGGLVLMAERTSGYVRFHAWQSVLGLGGLGLIVALLLGVSFAR